MYREVWFENLDPVIKQLSERTLIGMIERIGKIQGFDTPLSQERAYVRIPTWLKTSIPVVIAKVKKKYFGTVSVEEILRNAHELGILLILKQEWYRKLYELYTSLYENYPEIANDVINSLKGYSKTILSGVWGSPMEDVVGFYPAHTLRRMEAQIGEITNIRPSDIRRIALVYALNTEVDLEWYVSYINMEMELYAGLYEKSIERYKKLLKLEGGEDVSK